MLKKTNKYIWSILFMALVLRFIGLKHGFPFIFHPDEPTIVRSALGIRFDINPAHFDWPHLMIYLNYFLFMIFAKLRDVVVNLGYKPQVMSLLPLVWNDDLIFYFLSRAFSAIFGALTVIPVYLTAKTIFGKKAGILAGLAIAITPFHVWHSHYSLGDVPMAFFLSWSLYFSSKVLFKNETRNYIWAGLFVGLAATTKYNGLLIVGALILAHIMRVLSEKEEKLINLKVIKDYGLAAAACVVGFLAGTPFAVLDWETFIRTDGPKGALWQFTNVGKVDFVTHLKQFFEVITYTLPDDFGYTIIVLFMSAVIFVMVNAIIKKNLWLNKDLLFFVLVGLGLIFYISGLEKTRSHYFFVSYPAVIVGGVGFLSQQLEIARYKYKNLVWISMLVIPFYLSVMGAIKFYRIDTRQQLYYWVLTNKFVITKSVVMDEDLRPIFRKAGVETEKVDAPPEKLQAGTYFTASEESQKPDKFKLELFVDNRGRRGPNIWVFAP